ncbi:MAG TPA: PH domain-containing protein [Patescibacteria group bacterium]|nr:PH domain-containing protein [Patescibacteria group bacterium]
MGGKIEGKVIKPPVVKVTSGKIFRPSKAFRNKQLVKTVAIAATIWVCVMASFVLMAYFLGYVEPEEYVSGAIVVGDWWMLYSNWTLGLNVLWLIPALIVWPIYINSIEYSVKAETGETMPEIYVKKGIFTITRKHVPFRTITNIYSGAGVFDRLFGVGNVNIETAGYSGSNQTGPEEKLEGIVFFEEVRDFILTELRRFREPYVTGTEMIYPKDEPVPRIEGLEDEILLTLREIRDLLRKESLERTQ